MLYNFIFYYFTLVCLKLFLVNFIFSNLIIDLIIATIMILLREKIFMNKIINNDKKFFIISIKKNQPILF